MLNENKEIDKDTLLKDLCNKVSDFLFNNKDKYDPYTKVIITDSNIEILQGVQGIPVKRYGEGE